ncbi:MAG: NosD domain-containing protein [Candidatus Odinarchaeota archaeon]
MRTHRIFYPAVAAVLLLVLFPAVLAFSNGKIAGSNHLTVSDPVVQAKLASIQALPVVITDNGGFDGAGFTGDGTPDVPYVLKDAVIDASASGLPGINISNTDAYFRIENVTVSGSSNSNTGGIHLENVKNGQIINTTVTNNRNGFYLSSSSNNILTGNNATYNLDHGFYLSSSSNNTLAGNNATENEYSGFYLYSSSNNSLVGNTGTGNYEEASFILDNSSNNTLIGNNATENVFSGFRLYSSNNNTLTGNTASGNVHSNGFELESSSNNTLTGNMASGNGLFGFYLASSSNNTLTDNTANNNHGESGGFYLSFSNNNILIRNTATGNDYRGFYLKSSSNNTLLENNASEYGDIGFWLASSSNNNTLVGNSASDGIGGYRLASSSNNTLISNSANGNSGEEQGGFRLESSSNNNTLVGNTAFDNDFGFYLSSSNNNTLAGNNATGNEYSGFHLSSSSNNTFTGNSANGNPWGGFYLQSSNTYNILVGNNATDNGEGFVLETSNSYNTLTGNTASGSSTGTGFFLDSSNNYNRLTGNTATGNEDGFYLEGSSNNNLTGNTASGNTDGFILRSSSNNNTLAGNNATGNVENNFFLYMSGDNSLTGNAATGSVLGFGFLLLDSHGNNLTWNNVYNNTGHGIRVEESSGNLVYFNFLIDNNGGGVQGYDNSLLNSWTNGTHGNYWSDYTGTDAGNGIGDTNYTLDGEITTPPANDTRPLVFGLLVNISSLQLTGPGDLTFEAGSTGTCTITWLPVTNLLPVTYELYVNNGLEDTGGWTSETAIKVDVDLAGLALGTDYNYTLLVSDYSGKTVMNTVWVTVKDTTGPMITALEDFTVEAGPTAGTLSFTATDLFPANYTLYLDGSVNKSGDWTSGTPLTVALDSLPPGVHEFTLTVQDTSGNEATRTVLVTVEDTTDPVITAPADFTIEAGDIKTLSFTVTELFPANYTLYLDGSVNKSNDWNSGTPLTVALDSLPPGVHEFTLTVQDTSGNGATRTVLVTVEDTTDPVITAPADLTVEAGSTTITLSFKATDLFPANYTLYLDGSVNKSGNWTSSTLVSVPLDNLPLGHYNFTLVVQDTSGNGVTWTVLVTVEDTVIPVIVYTGSDNISFEEGSTGNNLTASATDLYPDTYTVYQNGTAVDSGDWVAGTAIIIDLDALALPAGVYNFTLAVEDTSGNGASLVVTVTVTKPAAAAPDLLGLLVLVLLIGAAGATGAAGFLFWRRRRG